MLLGLFFTVNRFMATKSSFPFQLKYSDRLIIILGVNWSIMLHRPDQNHWNDYNFKQGQRSMRRGIRFPSLRFHCVEIIIYHDSHHQLHWTACGSSAFGVIRKAIAGNMRIPKPARCHHGILSAVISQRHSHGFVILPNWLDTRKSCILKYTYPSVSI